MNPSLGRELDAAGAALVQRVRALPIADRRDMASAIDAKNDLANDLAKLMKRYREAGAGTAVPRPSDLFGGPVKIARQRSRRVEGGGGR